MALTALIFGGLLTGRAQVTNFAVFKVTVYHQTSTVPPVTPDYPNAYYCGVQLNLTAPDIYASADFLWLEAPPTSPALFSYLTQISDYNFNYGSPFYSTKTNFDADFGPGDYEIDGNYTNNATDSGYLTLPDPEIYATNVAAWSPNSWTRMQSVDPAQTVCLKLNAFGVQPGADEALTFINVFDPNGTPNGYSTNNVSLMLTNTMIPANTLLYGVNYEVDTFFSSRQDIPNAGFNGALGIIGFDNLTYTTLATIAPPLDIAPSGTNVVLTWPSLASNYNLESTTNLANGGGWLFLTNITQSAGLTNQVIYPATEAVRFYRLEFTPPSP